MTAAGKDKARRRPRFRRAATPPAFRLTADDVEMVRLLARHRFLRSTHIAALLGRSRERTNKRLARLFHAGYLDRPRAQLDYYPDAGSAPMVYALADEGARLLRAHDGTAVARVEVSRNNARAGRPFIEHQLAVMDFRVALELAAAARPDVRFMPPEELAAGLPEPPPAGRDPFALRITLEHDGRHQAVGLVPDFAFGLMFADGSKRCFLVEIDRGTMPVSRRDLGQSSMARKMRAYLAAHASGLHTTRFGWKTFRTLVVTTEARRMRAMIDALGRCAAQGRPGSALFLFASRDDLARQDPIALAWRDGGGRWRHLA